MSRTSRRAVAAIAVSLLIPAAPRCIFPTIASLHGGDQPSGATVETAARDALVKFDKDWKDYTNEPNFGDPRWKLKMETLVRLVRAVTAARPLLEEVALEGSSWKPHTRRLATETLAILRGPKAVREALASYDLAHMDTVQVGKAAPDFSLADANGTTYRLSQLRGKKTVVLSFILQDL